MVDTTLLFGFIAFTFAASITPGPNNLMVMASRAAFGWRRTLPHAAGIALGFSFMLAIVVLGLGALLDRYPLVMGVIRIAGCAWLLWLAWQLAWPALIGQMGSGEGQARSDGRPMRFYEAALFQWVNPKAWAMATAAAGAYVQLAASPVERALVMVPICFVLAVFCNGSWLLAGEALRRLTGDGVLGRFFAVGMAVLLGASALLILLG